MLFAAMARPMFNVQFIVVGGLCFFCAGRVRYSDLPRKSVWIFSGIYRF
jgi:hypothetical protein